MVVRRKALVVNSIRFVFDFSRHPQVLYCSKTILTHYSDECQTQSFGSYYVSLCFRFSSPSACSVLIKDCSDTLLWLVSDKKALVVNSIRYVSDIARHPQDLYRSKTVQTNYSIISFKRRALVFNSIHYVSDFPHNTHQLNSYTDDQFQSTSG